MALERRNVPKIGLIFKLKGLKSNVHAQCELWCQVPGARCQAPGVGCRVSGVGCRVAVDTVKHFISLCY